MSPKFRPEPEDKRPDYKALDQLGILYVAHPKTRPEDQ